MKLGPFLGSLYSGPCAALDRVQLTGVSRHLAHRRRSRLVSVTRDCNLAHYCPTQAHCH